ncbi:MAG TPA: nucleoside transporter C-terminal domain-containing protein [Terriglobia bacterium]|nr:nucleoside transporter C-terminal domain-containing protein [Terriglobia bacterium]
MSITRLIPLLGILVILSVAVLLSKNRKAIPWRTVGWGMGLQILVALFVLRTGLGYWLMYKVSQAFVSVLNCSFAGSTFLFGPLGEKQGSFGVVFAFQALPMIIFVASLMSILYYLRVIPTLVQWTGKAMVKLLGTSGAESLEVAASIMMGQTEAPLVIRPYLKDLTESELMTIMTAGMAHIAGSVFGAYVLFGAEARHLLTAVVMTAPGTIVLSKMLVPETGHPITTGNIKITEEEKPINLLDAASRGISDGLYLALNVAAMLIAFVALIALINLILGGIHTTLQTLLGYPLAPVAWLLGVPWKDATTVGNLMGTKLVLNEFVAFSMLSPLKGHIAERSFTIATYALCGFANFSSIGIQIGGIGALAPTRKQDLARMGFRALLAGTLANYMAAAIAGLLLA